MGTHGERGGGGGGGGGGEGGGGVMILEIVELTNVFAQLEVVH